MNTLELSLYKLHIWPPTHIKIKAAVSKDPTVLYIYRNTMISILEIKEILHSVKLAFRSGSILVCVAKPVHWLFIHLLNGGSSPAFKHMSDSALWRP